MNTRKVLSLALTIVLVFTFCVPAYASETHIHEGINVTSETLHVDAEENEIEASDTQNYHICKYPDEPDSITTLAGQSKSATASGCIKKNREIYYCTVDGCNGYVSYDRYASISTPHEKIVYNATCNGTYQTWYYHCRGCYYALGSDSTKICPGGPHSGSCNYLPV